MATATKKPAAKTAAKPAVAAKKSSTALVPWEEQMRSRANRVKQTEKPMSFSKRISTQGGILNIDGDAVADNEMEVIVIGWMHENQLYNGDYTPGTPTVPVCYAFNDPTNEDADPEDTMGANPKCDIPQGTDEWVPEQDEENYGNACKDCWANKMGTAEKGRGKACKNIRRLMVVTPDALESAETLEAAEMRGISIPVMSVKYWTKFANSIADDLQRDPSCVVARLYIERDPKAQFVIKFDFTEQIEFTQELWEAMEKKRAAAMTELAMPYPRQADLEAPAKTPARKMIPIKSAKGAEPGARKGKF